MTKAFLRKCWIALSSACLPRTAWPCNHRSPEELNYLLDIAAAAIINQAAAWLDGRRNSYFKIYLQKNP